MSTNRPSSTAHKAYLRSPTGAPGNSEQAGTPHTKLEGRGRQTVSFLYLKLLPQTRVDMNAGKFRAPSAYGTNPEQPPILTLLSRKLLIAGASFHHGGKLKNPCDICDRQQAAPFLEHLSGLKAFPPEALCVTCGCKGIAPSASQQSLQAVEGSFRNPTFALSRPLVFCSPFAALAHASTSTRTLSSRMAPQGKPKSQNRRCASFMASGYHLCHVT